MLGGGKIDGKGGCLKGKRGQREKGVKKKNNGDGDPLRKKRGNFEGKSWMEKGERFEKGGPRGKVKVGRWKDFFLQGKLRNTTGSSSHLSIKLALLHPKLTAAWPAAISARLVIPFASLSAISNTSNSLSKVLVIFPSWKGWGKKG